MELHFAPYSHVTKRAGANELMSTGEGRPSIRSAIILAVSGARRMPLRKWPLATKTPQAAVGPMMGRSSGVPGRNPAQLRVIGEDRSSGKYSAAALSNAGMVD